MKCAPFRVARPTSLDEVVHTLADHGDVAKVLAGGQSLIPLLALRLARFDILVDLNHVDELAGIEVRDTSLRIGAMTRQAAVATNADVQAQVPLLAEATGLIGHFQIRNRGTIGGSLAHADAAAEYPAVAIALDFDFEIATPRATRRVPAAEFFQGYWTTALAEDEILAAVYVPTGAGPRRGSSINEFARRHGDFALAGAVAAVSLTDEGAISEAAFSVFAAADRPLRLSALEAAVLGQAPENVDMSAAAGDVVADLTPPEDLHASADFRKHLLRHLLADAFAESVRRAKGAASVR